MLSEVPLLRNVNHRIDPKPGSEWLPTWRLSAHKFGQQINNKLNIEIKLVGMYSASNNKSAVVMFCVTKRDQPDKPRFVTDCRLRNLAVCKKQTPLHNMDKLIELVAICLACSKIDLADGYFNIRVEERTEKWNTILTTHGKMRNRVMS